MIAGLGFVAVGLICLSLAGGIIYWALTDPFGRVVLLFYVLPTFLLWAALSVRSALKKRADARDDDEEEEDAPDSQPTSEVDGLTPAQVASYLEHEKRGSLRTEILRVQPEDGAEARFLIIYVPIMGGLTHVEMMRIRADED